MGKRGPKAKGEDYKHIRVYSTENKVLDETIKIICKADVKAGDKVFIQDNIGCMHLHKFRISSGFYIVEDPDEILIIVENLRGYEPYRLKIGAHIADIIILQTIP